MEPALGPVSVDTVCRQHDEGGGEHVMMRVDKGMTRGACDDEGCPMCIDDEGRSGSRPGSQAVRQTGRQTGRSMHRI